MEHQSNGDSKSWEHSVMRLEPKPGWPSILVDVDRGLEFTVFADRDTKPPYQTWGCDWHGRSVATLLVKDIGMDTTGPVPVYRYLGSLSQLKRSFENRRRYFSEADQLAIGTFEKCLPIMLEAWRNQKTPPQLERNGGRVQIDLVDAGEI